MIEMYRAMSLFSKAWARVTLRSKRERIYIKRSISFRFPSTLILLFATLLVVSRDPEKVSRHGFNTTAVVAACSALFFVVLISHIQIRSQFGGTSVVYLEYYYYLTYFLLIATTVNTYLFSEDSSRLTWLIHHEDNILPKVAYWPFIFLYAVIVTHLVLQAPALQ